MSHAKTSFSTEIFAGAIISVVQYLAPLRYVLAPRALCHHSSRTLLHLEKVRILLELVMNTCLINATCFLHGDGGHAVTTLA
jgi:hypothetical protein